MRSGESSIELRPNTRICVVQRISDGTEECEGDGSQRKSEAVKKECRTLVIAFRLMAIFYWVMSGIYYMPQTPHPPPILLASLSLRLSET